ncbi:MAG: ornithine--oxo-acid transaminase [Chloroflexi bacterium]|nr:ornithine--oxo-acid transaminase [Chloroflexota bacterium]
MDQQSLIGIAEYYGAKNYHPLDVVIERGEGVWVYDVEGKRYLDCLSAYSALNQGHRHPRIIQALIDQAQRVTLTSRAFRNDQLPLLCQELCELAGCEVFLPMNTGAEAVETALKAARRWAYQVKGVPDGQAEIITCSNNFHGRTITIISCSTEPLYRDHFGPYTPGFVTIPFGDVRALEEAITPNTAAFLVEPIQAEAGVIMPPEGYLRQARGVCTHRNVLFLADEIQTGMGRTGKMFACQHEDVHPDVLIVGKALGGGVYPVSGVLASREILDVFQPGTHGSTFGGNPLGAAVARESLRVLQDEGLIENSAVLGGYFLGHLQEALEGNKRVRQVRGKGLLVGVELEAEVGGARQFCEELAVRGLLCKETHQDVIRFAPPLVIDRGTLDWAMQQIVQTLNMPLDELRSLV